MPPRLIFLTDHKSHARRMTKVLGEPGIPFAAVVVCAPPGQSRFNFWVWRMLAKARRVWAFHRVYKSFYGALKAPIYRVEGANSEAMRQALARLAPDYIVMGSCSILKPHIIETARCGVINAHPALLPWVRGSGVVGHSLEQGVPVGATVHFIDAGIDTGNIIERRLFPVTAPSEKLSELEEGANQLAVELMAAVLMGIVQTGHRPEAISQTARFPLFRWPDAEGRRRLNALAQEGRGLELFDDWKHATNGEPHWRLRPDIMEFPASPSDMSPLKQ